MPWRIYFSILWILGILIWWNPAIGCLSTLALLSWARHKIRQYPTIR